MILAFILAPGLIAALVCLPHIRGEHMTVPAVAAAIAGPVFLWTFFIDAETVDGTPAKLYSLFILVPFTALSAFFGWSAAQVARAMREG